MSKLYRYSIIVNKNPVRSKNSFSYSYGGTKDIELCVGKNSASLQFCMTVDHNETSLSKSDIFLDGLLKSAFSHLLIFGETMKVDQVLLLKDDKEAKEINCPQLYYLLEINKKIDVSILNRKNEILEVLLQSPFRSSGRKLSCMIAYLTAMSRNYYMERFNYLWISFNAFYDEMYVSSGGNLRWEVDHIQYLLCRLRFGNELAKNRDTREKMAKKLCRHISLWDGKEVMMFLSAIRRRTKTENVPKTVLSRRTSTMR